MLLFFLSKNTDMKKNLSLITVCLLFTLSGYSFTQIVSVKNDVFVPATFTVNIGDTIKWVWSAGSHTTTSLTIPSEAASWNKPINSSSTTFTYVAAKAGKYNFQCNFHAAMGMKGSFTVADCPNVSVNISAASSTTFCKGGSVLLNSNVSGSVTSYQWKKNGANITGATNSIYTAKASGSYTLMVANSCGKKATSSAVDVVVNPLPGANITPSDTVSICSGDSIKLKANTGTSITYMWKLNGATIKGITNNFYYAKKAGNYRVVVTKTTTGCSKGSDATTVVINCFNAISAKLPDNKILVFPNPSSNNFHITIPSFNNSQYSLSVFDSDGKLVGEKKIVSEDFSFGTELKQGIYFVEIKRDDAVIAKEKIIKK